MVVVMDGIVPFVVFGAVVLAATVFGAVVLAATKDARLVKESLTEITHASSVPISMTSQKVRPDKERVQSNV
jgi:hypothetical protein